MIFYFHPKPWGKMNPFWRSYVSNGLVQTTNQRNLNLGCLADFSYFFKKKTSGLQGLNAVLVAFTKKKNGVSLKNPMVFLTQMPSPFWIESCGMKFWIPLRSSIWWSWPLVLHVSILIGTRPHWVGEKGGELFAMKKKGQVGCLQYRFGMNNYTIYPVLGG